MHLFLLNVNRYSIHYYKGKSFTFAEFFNPNNNMKRKLFLCLIIGGIATQFSCESKDEIKCILPSTTISATSPAITGEKIYLTTPDYVNYESGFTFEWTGPNNFYSNEQNPIISNVTAAMKGEYKLVIKKGICASEAATVNIDVITNTVTCSQTDDTATFTNGGGSYNLYYNDAHAIVNDEYQISGSAYNMSIDVIFDGNLAPKQGVYTIVNKSIPLSEGKVHVKALQSGQFNYYALNGDVLLTYNAYGVATIKFCSVPFAYSTNTSADMNGSVKFTVNE